MGGGVCWEVGCWEMGVVGWEVVGGEGGGGQGIGVEGVLPNLVLEEWRRVARGRVGEEAVRCKDDRWRRAHRRTELARRVLRLEQRGERSRVAQMLGA